MEKKYVEAAEMYLDGAKDGIEIASYDYAYCLLHGYGVDQDFSAAKSFFTYARDMNGGESSYMLGIMYIEGLGVSKDYKAGIRYMSDAADMGCVEAMLYLGMVYTTGYVLYPDITSISMIPYHKSELRQEEYYLPSADGYYDTSDEEARFTVVRQDARMAYEYFRSAAYADPTYVEDLVAKGKYLFAKCYCEGIGVDFNRDLGFNLMLSAGKAGSEDAVAFLAENGITEKLLLEWKKKRKD